MGDGLSSIPAQAATGLAAPGDPRPCRTDWRTSHEYKEFPMKRNRRHVLAIAIASVAFWSLGLIADRAFAATAEDLNRSAAQALQNLYRTNSAAAKISSVAKAVLVFPNIVKAGLVFGGSYGEGVLMENAKAVDYYNSVSGSWGLQVGAQSFGYVVFLMNDKAVSYLKKSNGWEIGVGPTVVLVNEGVAKNLSSTTLQDDAYAFIFDQQGLMAGLSIEGTKISRIQR
jgi:lipid-binding SYLF domain-containing protein